MKLVSTHSRSRKAQKSAQKTTPQRETASRPAPAPRQPKKSGGAKGVLAVLLAVILFAAAAGGAYVIYTANNYETILPNVYAYGMNLGGLTEEEAATKLASAVEEPDETLESGVG